MNIKKKINVFFSSYTVFLFFLFIALTLCFSFYKYVILDDFAYEYPQNGEMPEIVE